MTDSQNGQLKLLQDRLEQLLKEFDAFCKENDIKYTLEGGTALGAYRHGGFIPWDDDVDIRMDLKDYRKFCEVVDKKKPSVFVLQNHQTERLYYAEYAKIRDTHSYFRENNFKVKYKNEGAFLDIFVYENAFPVLVAIAHWLYRPLLFLCHMPLHKLKTLHALANAYYSIVRVFVKLFRGISTLFRAKSYSYTYGSFIYTFKWRYSRDMFAGERKMKFGDSFYPVPNQIEKYLQIHYGDNYMTLPPVEKRMPHHIEEFIIYQ